MGLENCLNTKYILYDSLPWSDTFSRPLGISPCTVQVSGREWIFVIDKIVSVLGLGLKIKDTVRG